MKTTKILSIALLIGIMVMVGCSKEPCEKGNFGNIQISNSSSNPYGIWIDNIYKGQVAGNSMTDRIELRVGVRDLYAEQASGYVFSPTTRSSEVTVIQCKNYSWQIP